MACVLHWCSFFNDIHRFFFKYCSFTRGATDWNNLSSGKFDISQLKWDDCGAGESIHCIA